MVILIIFVWWSEKSNVIVTKNLYENFTHMQFKNVLCLGLIGNKIRSERKIRVEYELDITTPLQSLDMSSKTVKSNVVCDNVRRYDICSIVTMDISPARLYTLDVKAYILLVYFSKKYKNFIKCLIIMFEILRVTNWPMHRH